MKPGGWFRPQFGSGRCVSTVLAMSPSGVWDGGAPGDAVGSVRGAAAHGWHWVAHGVTGGWGTPERPARRVLCRVSAAGGTGCCAQERWDHILPRRWAHPAHPPTDIAAERKRVGRITDLATWRAEQGLSGREGRGPGCYRPFPLCPLAGLFSRCASFSHQSRLFLLMTWCCKPRSVIDLQQGWRGCKLVRVFPTVSVCLFKAVNSSSRPGLAVRYGNERSPSSAP